MVEYGNLGENDDLPAIAMDSSEYSPNACIFRNDEFGVWLYHANCMEFMDVLIGRYPQGKFDMIFADPPCFLSNGGEEGMGQSNKLVPVDNPA